MNTNTIATPSASKPEAINQSCPTVCSICEGIGKEGHTRSKTVDTLHSDPFPTWYIYLHLPGPEFIRSSYERYGCQTCRLILACIQHESKGSPGPQGEQARDDRDRLANFDLAQDTQEAASLVSSAEVGVGSNDLQIERCGPGRVALCIREPSQRWSPRVYAKWGRLEVYIHVFETASVAPRLPRRLNLICSPVDTIDEHHVHRPATDLLSGAHVSLVRSWMSGCEAEHKICVEHSKTVQKLPTRLLKIAGEIEGENGELIRVRLVDTNEVEGIYACLSYCWGSNCQVLLTTKGKLNEYRQEIPWRKLPSTISDAIKLCYRLGFKYLWVDSLCIVQDDDQDWLREASNMAGIYSRSALTLAIHLCNDASKSFLQKRLLDTEQWSDGPYGCSRIPSNDPETGDKRDMYLWQDQSFKGSRFLDRWWTTVQTLGRRGPSGHWLSRAWTLQEWLLSPRVLHIHAMTVWDCFEGLGNELEMRSIRKSPFKRAISNINHWQIIVHDFTSRRITKEKDRLPALAGLAERFQAQTGYVYLAGLWLERLPQSLVWARYGSHTMSKPLTYRAPTWSWAALEGAVIGPPFEYEDVSPTSKIIGHYCQYDPPETFATVIDGWLDIEGPMSVVSALAMHDDGSRLSPRGFRMFTRDQPQAEDVQNPQYWVAKLDLDQSLIEEIRRNEIHLLDVLAAVQGKVVFKYRRFALVLQIVSRPGTGQDCFQRLGIATVSASSSSIPNTDSWTRRKIRLI